MLGNRRRRSQGSNSGGSAWLATYSDMVTLLLAFFVLLFTFSSLDADKFRAIMSSFQGAFGVLDTGTAITQDRLITAGDAPSGEIVMRNPREWSETLEVMERLMTFQSDQMLDGTFTLEATERGVVIHFTDRVLFDTGRAEIKPAAEEVLAQLAGELGRLSNVFRVEGHTDDVPIHNTRYPSNWELSSARATSVVRFLIGTGSVPADRFSAVGYGEYRPIAANDHAEGRARNRRVDIVILNSDLRLTEPSAFFGQEGEVH